MLDLILAAAIMATGSGPVQDEPQQSSQHQVELSSKELVTSKDRRSRSERRDRREQRTERRERRQERVERASQRESRPYRWEDSYDRSDRRTEAAPRRSGRTMADYQNGRYQGERDSRPYRWDDSYDRSDRRTGDAPRRSGRTMADYQNGRYQVQRDSRPYRWEDSYGTNDAPSVSRSGPPCSGLSGTQRTRCLNAEVERGRRELAEIERRNRSLDNAIILACVARHGARIPAGLVGSAVLTGVTVVGDRMLNNSHPCLRAARRNR